MPASRHVRELSQARLFELDQVYRVTNSADIRTRCQILLLSSEGYSTPEIARLVRFSEDSVLCVPIAPRTAPRARRTASSELAGAEHPATR